MPNQLLTHELETPLINAAGLVNGSEVGGVISDVETLAATSVGAITVGSFTVPKRMGNAHEFGEPTYHYDHDTGTMTNSLGLPNIGIEQAEQLVDEIKDAAGDKPVIFSISPTAGEGIGDSVDQSVEMINRLFGAGAALVELNVSCPNVVTASGGRKPVMGHDIDTMADLVDALYEEVPNHDYVTRLGIKLPPYRSVDELGVQKELADLFRGGPLGFLTTSNTIPGGRPTDEAGQPILTVPGGGGGISGPSTKVEGRLQLALWKDLTPELPIISTLGVYDGEEIAARESMGAVAVEMNTRLWNSTNWKATVAEVLGEYAQFQE